MIPLAGTIYRPVVLILGMLYPSYQLYKAVRTKSDEEEKWMNYWIVFAQFTCVEFLVDIYICIVFLVS